MSQTGTTPPPTTHPRSRLSLSLTSRCTFPFSAVAPRCHCSTVSPSQPRCSDTATTSPPPTYLRQPSHHSFSHSHSLLLTSHLSLLDPPVPTRLHWNLPHLHSDEIRRTNPKFTIAASFLATHSSSPFLCSAVSLRFVTFVFSSGLSALYVINLDAISCNPEVVTNSSHSTKAHALPIC
ncbi:hypothetical protein BVRB_4g085770 [Beta vulgaris subsp. vulgaris]|nr:hypothetical protein BVRB_4g085770 [Beta vulgaris subsp. vulgaris]